MQERRQYIRLSKSLIIIYRVKNQFLRSGTRSKDICAGGICLPVFQRLESGTILELEIRLSEYGKPIKAIGEVAWVRKIEDAQFPFEIGIKFINIDASEQRIILDYVTKSGKGELRWL
jgi:c-di-GMP-binding flagellar brake protein YcgR